LGKKDLKNWLIKKENRSSTAEARGPNKAKRMMPVKSGLIILIGWFIEAVLKGVD